MKITVAGVGYVGLSLAVLLAQKHQVMAITTTPSKADKLNEFISPIKDDEIERFFDEKKCGLRELDLVTTTDKDKAYEWAEMVIIATSTNYDDITNSFDTSAVEDVIEYVLKVNPECPMVIKSTVPVGYTDSVREKYGITHIVFSPEFLRESKALYDNLHPSRVIVGAHSDQIQLAEQFAQMMVDASEDKDVPVRIMPPTEAEAVKLFSNTYLAMRVAYFNELDSYAMTKNLDVKSIIDGVSLDPRIGNHYNNPSFGYGGYCLPKDTKQLLANFKKGMVPQNIIGSIVESNTTRKEFIARQIIDESPKVVGIYRLVMKSNSDNFRASAIQDIMQTLGKAAIEIIIYEPTLQDEIHYQSGLVVNDFQKFCGQADIILANRLDENLEPVSRKVFSRDLFSRD